MGDKKIEEVHLFVQVAHTEGYTARLVDRFSKDGNEPVSAVSVNCKVGNAITLWQTAGLKRSESAITFRCVAVVTINLRRLVFCLEI